MIKKINNNFKVLKGGLLSAKEPLYKFVSSFVTNTRLMGVEVLYIHWQEECENCGDENHLHQFFYFDGEEYGLENYVSYRGVDPLEISNIESLLAGGLGGNKNEISQIEATFLVQNYIEASKKLKVDLPENKKEFYFLIKNNITLSPSARNSLYKKECTRMENNYQTIHYFLMRIFARDFEFANYLCGWKSGEVDLYPELKACTLVKNTIEEVNDQYLCESLIDLDGNYYIAVSEISLKNKEIVSFIRHKLFKITPYEAALLINRTEYITCYDVIDDNENFINEVPDFYTHTFTTSYDKGKLFMLYNPNNDHVKKPVFKIHEDVYGSYFISIMGQILISSFIRDNLAEMEKIITHSNMADKLLSLGRFEFKEPVLYEFIQDDIDDFIDFIDFYKE